MSKDILDEDIKRRESANAQLIAAAPDIEATIEQFNKLDEVHRSNEKKSRDRLVSIYKESRHYTGKQHKVFSFAETEKYPFFGGPEDTDCNPYFPISKVRNGTYDGLSPLNVPPTKTGAWARETNFSPLETTVRTQALNAVQAFPDTSGETGSGVCTGAEGSSQSVCETNGGTWTPPSYSAGATATEKLKTALDAWKAAIEGILADLYNNPGNSEQVFWENIISKIDDILPSIQSNVSYPNNTQDFLPGSTADLARDYLIANTTSISEHADERKAYLEKEAATEEELFFGVIKLRMHAANGSFAKLKACKSQKATNKSIIDDNIAAIRSLNLLKARSS